MNTFFEILLIVFIVYAVGFYLAYIVSLHYINKYNTKESPLIPALFSWITILLLIIARPLYRLYKKFHNVFNF